VPVSPDEARSLARSLPEAVEQDHHGRPSFCVAGKIFATLWSEERMNVMLDEGGILTAMTGHRRRAKKFGGAGGSRRWASRSRGSTPSFCGSS
jgi:hypothetical protein